MTDSLRVRRYRPTDAPAVWAVHEAALRASPLPFVEDAPADADLRNVRARYLDPGGEFLVGALGEAGDAADATGTGEPRAGAASRDATEAPAADGEARIVAIGGYVAVDDRTAELRRMRVAPEHQRRGYASRLLAELEERARTAGFEVAVLETVETLRAARALYRDHGYEVVERTVHPHTGDEVLQFRKGL